MATEAQEIEREIEVQSSTLRMIIAGQESRLAAAMNQRATVADDHPQAPHFDQEVEGLRKAMAIAQASLEEFTTRAESIVNVRRLAGPSK